jgi:hypothetical protein
MKNLESRVKPMTKYKIENKRSIGALISGCEIKNPLLPHKSKITSRRLKK